MKKTVVPYKFETLSDYHRVVGIPMPTHPLISLINNMDGHYKVDNTFPQKFTLSFYKITFMPNLRGKIKYGQHYHDFQEGGLIFVSPNQVTGSDHKNVDYTGYSLYIHPDFLQHYSLAKTIKQYNFFSYAVSEALHLSEKEKETIITVFNIMEEELNNRIDDYSQDVIISQIELLLNYANRFYKRQFITRKSNNNDLIQQIEHVLNEYFETSTEGIPTVQTLAEKLNISSSYLSDMLRFHTGQSAQQHIHNKLIEKAKEKLSTTNLSVSEVAYELGFEHSQSFSKLFKTKTNLSPLAFRKSFN
jgi:AraC family transcriptional regulator, transcriptional activator of pobA